MKIHSLKFQQDIPIPIEQAWAFISDPRNLPKITPPNMEFSITSEVPSKIYPGLIITYRVAPLFRIPLCWVTEITHVDQGRYFVDEQRFGPYRFWHHQHFLQPLSDNATSMLDIVHYALPFDPFSRLIHPILVRKRLNAIFCYRKNKLRELFPSPLN